VAAPSIIAAWRKRTRGRTTTAHNNRAYRRKQRTTPFAFKANRANCTLCMNTVGQCRSTLMLCAICVRCSMQRSGAHDMHVGKHTFELQGN
jgi:hypothetical protein